MHLPTRETIVLPPAVGATMPRYYFDIVDGQGLIPDDEGIEMADQRSAEIEAAKSLAEMARDTAPIGRHQMSIEVRTDKGPVFQASFIFELTRLKH